jgi:hypothetical protein
MGLELTTFFLATTPRSVTAAAPRPPNRLFKANRSRPSRQREKAAREALPVARPAPRGARSASSRSRCGPYAAGGASRSADPKCAGRRSCVVTAVGEVTRSAYPVWRGERCSLFAASWEKTGRNRGIAADTPKENPRFTGALGGADDGTRTHDLLHGNARPLEKPELSWLG